MKDDAGREGLALTARFVLSEITRSGGEWVWDLRVAEYRVRSFDYGLDFGREFGNFGEVRTGVRREEGSSRVRTNAAE